jgi:hypothetical protein
MGDGRRAGPLLTWADRLVLYALLGCGVVLLAASWGGGGAGGSARIRGADGYDRVVRLDEDARYEVPGPLGTSVVEVRAGGVRMASSPCPGHVCERMGPADAAGEVVVCVPNGVAVTVLGVPERDSDALTR